MRHTVSFKCKIAYTGTKKNYKYKRVACVDFDVHWGNGNYDVMRNNKNSLYISTHQYPFYPGGGTDKDKGDFNNSLTVSYTHLRAHET